MASVDVNLLLLDKLAVSDLTGEQVRDAFRLRLPYRLRIGDLRRFRVDVDGPVEIWFRNTIGIPEKTSFEVGWSNREYWNEVSDNDLWTDTLIILEETHPTVETLNGLRAAGAGEPDIFALMNGDTKRAAAALLHFINSYINTAGPGFENNVVRPLVTGEFFRNSLKRFTLLCKGSHQITETQALQMFEHKRFVDRTNHVKHCFLNHFADLSHDQITRLEQETARQHGKVFYEFEALAKSRMLNQDHRQALLMAVVALEGVHATFLSKKLYETISADAEIVGMITNDLLKAGNFLERIKKTLLFVTEDKRPSKETLAMCRRGIEIRNDVMHSGMRKDGGYKMTEHQAYELSEAFAAVLAVFKCFEEELTTSS